MNVAENIQWNNMSQATAFFGAVWALSAQSVPRKDVDSVIT